MYKGVYITRTCFRDMNVFLIRCTFLCSAKRLYSTDEKVKARPTVDHTMDEEELANFSRLAASWWDESGEFVALHSMNKLRIPFIRDALVNNREEGLVQRCLPLDGLKIVDAGSGGGLLAEVSDG